MIRLKRSLSIRACALAAVLALCACAPPAEGGVGGSTVRRAVQSGEVQFAGLQPGDTLALISTSKGDIHAVLYPRHAPLAAENFRLLAQSGYYGGSSFGRVVQDFIIQGGANPGGEDHSFWGAPLLTERTDLLRHYSGALCMAAGGGENTHQSQFYIVATPQDGMAGEEAQAALRAAGLRGEVADAYAAAGGAPYLDNRDTVFGQVISGMDVVDEIAAAPVDEDGRPKAEVTILGVSVDIYEGGAPPAAASGSAGASQPEPPASHSGEEP